MKADRYIDAEQIKYHELYVCGGHGLNFEYTVAYKHEVDAIPTADVVEVVRCKDCIFMEKSQGACCYCRLHDTRFERNGFCSYGKAKGERNESGTVS